MTGPRIAPADPLRPGVAQTPQAVRRALYIAHRIKGLGVKDAMMRAGYAETTASMSPVRQRLLNDPDVLRDIADGLARSLHEIAPSAPQPVAIAPRTAAASSPAQSSPHADTPVPARPSPPSLPAGLPAGFRQNFPYRHPAQDRNAILRPGHRSTRIDLSHTKHVPADFPLRPEDYTAARPRIDDMRGRIKRRAYSVRRVGVRPEAIDD